MNCVTPSATSPSRERQDCLGSRDTITIRSSSSHHKRPTGADVPCNCPFFTKHRAYGNSAELYYRPAFARNMVRVAEAEVALVNQLTRVSILALPTLNRATLRAEQNASAAILVTFLRGFSASGGKASMVPPKSMTERPCPTHC